MYLFSQSVRRRPLVVLEEPVAAAVVPAVEDDADVFLPVPPPDDLPFPPIVAPASFLFGATVGQGGVSRWHACVGLVNAAIRFLIRPGVVARSALNMLAGCSMSDFSSY